jgi:hypothetical protein
MSYAEHSTTWPARTTSVRCGYPDCFPAPFRGFSMFHPVGMLLTEQPFGPKLCLTNMIRGVRFLSFLLLLFAVFFLGAQLHYCADVASAPAGTHICPVCSAVGAAVMTAPVSLLVVSQVKPLESMVYAAVVTAAVPKATSPRAPPAV